MVCQHACLLQLTECRGVQAFGFSMSHWAKKIPLSRASQESRVPPAADGCVCILTSTLPTTAIQQSQPKPQAKATSSIPVICCYC